MKKLCSLMVTLLCVFSFGLAHGADVVPVVIEQPGTQPNEVGNLESPDKCDNCHGGYNKAVEPAFNWRGSAMGNAGRDPIFWATLAVAEQDFDGAGDLCIRCHSTGGWMGGRSTPTDGSGLAASDDNGVDCDTCHKMTNPDDSEHLGEQFPPHVANDPLTGEGYYGSGMLSLWGGSDKLGPFNDAEARHKFMQSKFHRSVDFCGSCHDVSNPAAGNLAPNNGAQATADAVTADGALDGVVDTKAAFNNPPYMYGIVERTFSEFKAGDISKTLVSDYLKLPADLQGGALQAGYESALAAGTGGNYADGTPRYFSCQTCHVRPVTGQGCNKNPPVRKDLPLHDMTGGNYWLANVVKYQNSKGQLRLGGGLSALQIEALDAGSVRAMKQLSEAVSLSVNGNTLKVVNQTGHKVISGYPEGRRMWLNIKWYDSNNVLIREDGKYGNIGVAVVNPAGGPDVQVKSIVDLHDPNTKIYEAHYAMTQEWGAKLISLGSPASLPLSFDRNTGDVDFTLGELAAQAPGTYHETFHFVLNNHVAKDNRIPPYGMNREVARKRNALPVPADQYGNPAANGAYNYWDDIALSPPAGATYANIDMLYQGTSWEYIQFLNNANDGLNPFLGAEGINMLDAWLNTGMVAPYVMTSTIWGTTPTPATKDIYADTLRTYLVGRKGAETLTSTFTAGSTVTIKAHVVDENMTALSGAQVFMNINRGETLLTSLQGFTDATGTAVLSWNTSRKQTTGTHTGVVTNILKNGYQFNPASGVKTVTFTIQ
jgi:hypothetical protein